MEFKFWGVRGTSPVCGSDKIKYGGHSPCASLNLSGGNPIIIDAGTGLISLGKKLKKKKLLANHINLFLTHFHLDHIIGLPYFAPLFSPHVTINFYAVSEPQETQKNLNRLMGGVYFPVHFEDTPSKKIFKKITKENINIGELKISSCPLVHPQGNVALKIEQGEQKIVYATDTEHPDKGVDERLVSFSEAVNFFIYDAMYTPEEYESGKKGWGHSTWLAGAQLARKAGIQSLYLSHFNPEHSDKQIDEFISLAQQEFRQTHGAKEGAMFNV